MKPTVVLFDYGSGNIRSGERALARAGAAVEVTSSVSQALAADGVVLPGVGAFAACMASLHAVDGARMVRERLEAAKPLLGICVGHQVLYEVGDEHGELTKGLGVWAGSVSQLRAPVLPHVGWNTLSASPASTMFEGIGEAHFYFVHSFGVHEVTTASAVGGETPLAAWSSYGDDIFVAAVEDGPLWSTQFHPEKSGEAGIALLTNWINTL